MNKETFLKELREYLKILEDREQEDILDEYAQHIDMKMQKGLSEEEAIRDFGSMEELVAEILEAYHVKPEFSRKKEPVLMPKIKEGIADGGKGLGRMVRFLKQKFLAAIRGIVNGFRWLGGKAHLFAEWLGKPFRKKKEQTALIEAHTNAPYPPKGAGGTEAGTDLQACGDLFTGENADQTMTDVMKRQSTQKGTKDMAVRANGFLATIGHGITAIWRAIIGFCIWGLKLMWNCGWLLFSLLLAFFTMITLLGFGTVLIFLLQGYPFTGILLMSLGGILCFGSLTCAAFGMIIRKQKEEDKDTEKKKDKEDKNKDDKTGTEQKEECSGEEVQYE